MEIAILAGAGILAAGILVRHLLVTLRGIGCPGCGGVCDGCRRAGR